MNCICILFVFGFVFDDLEIRIFVFVSVFGRKEISVFVSIFVSGYLYLTPSLLQSGELKKETEGYDNGCTRLSTKNKIHSKSH